jgi:hypothetical protein
MCHTSVLTWAGSLPAVLFAGKSVIEVGSYDVNGTVRPIIGAHGPASYVGVDMSPGPGVDVVAHVADLPDMYPAGFDVVVTTEMLEHVEDWRSTFVALTALVKDGGHLVLSTRSPGFVYHPFPIDCWRYPVPLMAEILEACGFDVEQCIDDPEAPGVFAVARNRGDLDSNALEAIEVPGV